MALGIKKTIDTLIWLLPCLLFIQNMYNTYITYKKGFTVFVVREENVSYTPPILLCSNIPLNPIRLREFGMAASFSDNYALLRAVRLLDGIPANVSLEKLLEISRWPLGFLLESVKFGKVSETYGISTETSPLWKVNPVNPLCYELKSFPVEESTTLIFYKRPKSKMNLLHGNISLGLDQTDRDLFAVTKIMKKLFYSFFQLPSSSSVYSLANWDLHSQKLNIWKSYQKVFQFYSVTLINQPTDGLFAQQKCERQCYVERAEKERACFKRYPEQGDRLQKPCVLYPYMFPEKQCLKNCGNPATVNRWRLMRSKLLTDKNTFKVSVQKKKKVLREEYIYATYHFFSDIGGGLGLFLGMSLYSIISLVNYLKDRKRIITKKTWNNLFFYSCHLLLYIIATVHVISSTRDIVKRPRQTLVSLYLDSQINTGKLCLINNSFCFSNYEHPVYHSSDSTSESTTIVTNNRITQILAQRFATRAFGCQIPSEVNIFTQCMLNKQTSAIFGVYPYLYVKDLPLCTRQMLRFPYREFVIPTDLQDIATDERAISECVPILANISQISSRVLSQLNFKVIQSYGYTNLGIFLEISGIISLYLGISLTSLLEVGLREQFLTEKVKLSHLKYAKWVTISLLGILSVYIGVEQIHKFLLQHPVLTVIKAHGIEERKAISATICHWPPVNVSRLLRPTSNNNEYANTTYDSADVNDTLQALASDFAKNRTFFLERWYKAIWEASDVGINLDENWEALQLIGHKCWKFTVNSTNASYKFSRSSLAQQKLIVFHPSQDLPILTLFDKVQKFSGYMLKTAGYRSIGEQHNKEFGFCMENCIQENLSSELNCSLPFLKHSIYNAHCNLSIILMILEWATQPYLDPMSLRLYPFMNLIKGFQENCLVDCRTAHKTLLHFMANGQEYIMPGITVFPTARIILHLDDRFARSDETEEVDCLTIYQLISKIG
ncbi:hypothetical protein SK128_024458, partial [Halocaridina rubra]